MKKFITLSLVALVAVASYAGKIRIAEVLSDADGDATISVTDYSTVVGIMGDVIVSGQTNTYTASVSSTFATNGTSVTASYAYITTQTDIQGSETAKFFNYDADSSTGDLQWLKPGDSLVISGSTQTFYKVTFESEEK